MRANVEKQQGLARDCILGKAERRASATLLFINMGSMPGVRLGAGPRSLLDGKPDARLVTHGTRRDFRVMDGGSANVGTTCRED